MGIFIKGINLPKYGFEELHIYPDGSIEYRESDESIIRVPNAVTEVKTPHGRLIDAYAIDKQVGERYMEIYEKLGGIDLETMCSPTGYVIQELLTIDKLVLEAPSAIEEEE